MEIRPLEEADWPGVVAITHHAIRGGVAHFGTELPPLEVLRAARQRLGPAFPCLVAREGDALLGFAQASPYKPRGAYAWTVELGVYVAESAQGRGVAKALYARLIPQLEALGFRTLLAGITLPNPASVRLHERFGFRQVGTLPQVGFKHGAWRDVGFWALRLGEGDPGPAPG